MRYKGVIFDLYGTLVRNFSHTTIDSMIEGVARIIGADTEGVRKVWNATFMDRAVGTFAPGDAMILHTCAELGLDPGPEAVREAVELRVQYFRDNFVPRDDAVSTITRLQEAGVHVGLLSDCSFETGIVWPEGPFGELIPDPVFSFELGIKKPDPRIYHIALERVGIAPEETLYVGDGSSRELTGAAAVGMTPLLIRVPLPAGRKAYHIDKDDWQETVIESLSEVLEYALCLP